MEAIDILYYTLAGSVVVLTIFISVTLVYLLFILRDVTKIADKFREVIDKVDRYITKPILLTKSVIEFITPFIQGAEERVSKKKTKR
jgi:predicted PurR-regulated permease PerM